MFRFVCIPEKIWVVYYKLITNLKQRIDIICIQHTIQKKKITKYIVKRTVTVNKYATLKINVFLLLQA